MTFNSVGRYYHIKGSTLGRYYKDHLSGFGDWDQKGHAAQWALLPNNLSVNCSIDETQLCDEVYTLLTSKAGHGKRKSLIATVKGTKTEDVSAILLKIPEEERAKVKEVTMDFSDSMYGIVKTCFPNATIVIDCFHIVQRLCEALDEMRLRFKRLAVIETKKEAAAFNQREDERQRKRMYDREWYAKNKAAKTMKGRKRGRKRLRKRKFQPQRYANGDTKIELLTRARTILYKSGEKWGDNQKTRAKILFDNYDKLREGYSLICKIKYLQKAHYPRTG